MSAGCASEEAAAVANGRCNEGTDEGFSCGEERRREML